MLWILAQPFAGHVWEGEEISGSARCGAFTCNARCLVGFHTCVRAHAATFYITTANRMRTNALRTPLRYPSQQLASCCLHAWKCFACWIGSDLGTPLDVTSDLLTEHNHIRWFHIQNAYLNSLRGHNEHWRVLGVCQQSSTTCVWCDILHEVFCLIARSENQLRSS